MTVPRCSSSDSVVAAPAVDRGTLDAETDIVDDGGGGVGNDEVRVALAAVVEVDEDGAGVQRPDDSVDDEEEEDDEDTEVSKGRVSQTRSVLSTLQLTKRIAVSTSVFIPSTSSSSWNGSVFRRLSCNRELLLPLPLPPRPEEGDKVNTKSVNATR